MLKVCYNKLPNGSARWLHHQQCMRAPAVPHGRAEVWARSTLTPEPKYLPLWCYFLFNIRKLWWGVMILVVPEGRLAGKRGLKPPQTRATPLSLLSLDPQRDPGTLGCPFSHTLMTTFLTPGCFSSPKGQQEQMGVQSPGLGKSPVPLAVTLKVQIHLELNMEVLTMYLVSNGGKDDTDTWSPQWFELEWDRAWRSFGLMPLPKH